MNISFTGKFLLSLAMISSSVFSASAQEDGPQPIVGGTSVEVGEYPWFTMLIYMSGQRQLRQGCGGMLVSPEYVLTAAHCINNKMKRRGAVRIGAFKSPYKPGDNGEQYLEFFRLISRNNGKAVTVHPNYNSITLDNDFALLRLEAESTIAPVPLDSGGETYENLWTIGHGSTKAGGLQSDDLLHVKVNYVTNSDCTSKYSYDDEEITDSMMCATDDGKDSCQGDSGGPLYDKDIKAVVGVVSWGEGCANENYPGVYSRVSDQYDWIKEVICENSNTRPAWCGEPPIVSNCEDSTLLFKFKVNGRTRFDRCSLVGANTEYCDQTAVKTMCPNTCDTCDLCKDLTSSFKIKIGKKLKTKRCSFATKARCLRFEQVRIACRESCNTC